MPLPRSEATVIGPAEIGTTASSTSSFGEVLSSPRLSIWRSRSISFIPHLASNSTRHCVPLQGCPGEIQTARDYVARPLQRRTRPIGIAAENLHDSATDRCRESDGGFVP